MKKWKMDEFSFFFFSMSCFRLVRVFILFDIPVDHRRRPAKRVRGHVFGTATGDYGSRWVICYFSVSILCPRRWVTVIVREWLSSIVNS